MTFYQWIGDARDARRSGTLGIPLVGDLPPTPTGRQSEIGRAADNAVAKIRQGTQMATRRLEADHARLLEQIRQKDDKIVGLSGEEADILAREPVRLAVEAGLDGSVIASRRSTDNRKAAAPLRAKIDHLIAERDDLATVAAYVNHDIEMAWRAARARARAIGETARRREARYFRLLCRRHPDGVRLAALFDHPRVDLPAWVDGHHDERDL
jgi:hypothetical protein